MRKFFLILIASFILVSCGGGGGESAPAGNGAPVNAAPVANAGPAQNVVTGTLVTLDGSGSSDVNGDLWTCSWSFTSRPNGSAAALSNTTAVKPTFTPDVAGAYVVSLIVNDGQANSVAATVTVTASAAAANAAPVANAGPAQNVVAGTLVTLNGGGSSDANGDPLTYSWSFTSRPNGSGTALSNATAASPTFTPDVAGAYVVSLIVNDGQAASAAATVTVTASAAAVVNVNAANAAPFDASTGAIVFNVHPTSTFTYNVANFAAGDQLVFDAGTAVGLINISGADGIIDVVGSLNNQAVTVHLTGIAAAADGAIFGVNSFNTVFGAGSLLPLQ